MSDAHRRRRRLARALKGRVRGRLHTRRAARMLYATDASLFMVDPLAAFVPLDIDDLAIAVKTCAELGIPIHPRGGATGLAGESLGPGLVIDCHPAFNQIADLDLDRRTVRVGAGVTLERLNRSLAPHGLMFGPDPSSGTRATLGGMIGSNATGAHSLVYGYTADHVRALTTVTSEGELKRLTPGPLSALPQNVADLAPIIDKWRGVIARAYPAHPRNRSGYDLRGVWDGLTLDPIRLMCGAEGTLGLTVAATLSLVERPAASTLLMLLFESLDVAARAVPALLEHRPAAVELIDQHVLEIGRRRDPRINELIPESAQAVLLAEWSAAHADEVAESARVAAAAFNNAGGVLDARLAETARDRAGLWYVRKESEALIQNQPGRERAISFVEDTAVPPAQLADYLDAKDRVMREHGFRWATFGHAGSGEMHTKVFIDPQRPDDYKRLVEMAGDLYDAAISMGGTMSGEHSDGLLRSPFLPKQYPELFPAFAEVKAAIDPEDLFNPGRKTVAASEHPALVWTRLSGRVPREDFRPLIDFGQSEAAQESAACHGCAACRGDAPELRSCPFFKLTRDELHAPRAIGNLSRLSVFGPSGGGARLERVAREVADACFNCKMCLIECPSQVDIPRLALLLKAEQTAVSGLNRSQRLILALDPLSRLARMAAPLANRMRRSKRVRRFANRLTGLDARAPLPSFASGSFPWKASRMPQPEGAPRVAYYPDSFVLHHDHALGLALVRLLNHLGYAVEIIAPGGSGLPALDIGAPDRARAIARAQLIKLKPIVEQGLPLLFSEPSAALMLRDEWPMLLPKSRLAHSLAAQVRDATAFLAEALGATNAASASTPPERRFAHHTPCHLKAFGEHGAAERLFSSDRALDFNELERGCCGMAGAWGLFEQNRERSLAIGSDLAAAINDGGFDGVLCECSTCRMQLAALCPTIDVRHPISLLAERLNL